MPQIDFQEIGNELMQEIGAAITSTFQNLHEDNARISTPPTPEDARIAEISSMLRESPVLIPLVESMLTDAKSRIQRAVESQIEAIQGGRP